MVMDYIEGPTLAEYIRNTSRKLQFPAAEDIVYIFTQVSLALDYAHEKGMIHRDIKPANIMLDERHLTSNALGLPILTDFGIAKLQGGAADTSAALGTPLYVSPEQAQGHAGDKSSDLYSLGIILYEITTGVTPFRGDSLLAILMQHFQELPTPPALINPNIPPALSEVILKSIAKDPQARFPSASAMTIELAEALNVPVPVELIQPAATLEINVANITPANVLSRSSVGADLSSPSPQRNAFQFPRPVAPPEPVVQPPAAPQPPARQRKNLYIVLIALLIVVVSGSGLLYAFFARNGTNTPSSANSVVGQAHFLSSPNAAPPGSIDEVQITIQHIHDAPAGEHYYAWLQISSEGLSPIHWLLTTQNGSLSSSYTNPHLLTNRPYLLLITAETADNGVATFDPNARFYYASLPNTIQNSVNFDIRLCPQGSSNNICMS